jgi:hypothetical protein
MRDYFHYRDALLYHHIGSIKLVVITSSGRGEV